MLIRLLAIAALCFAVAACAPSYRYHEGSYAGAEGDYYYSDPQYADGYYALHPSFSGHGHLYGYDPFFRSGFYYGMNRYPYHYGWGPRFAYATGFGYPYGYRHSSFYYGYRYLAPPRRYSTPRALSAREEAERLARADRSEAVGASSRSIARGLRSGGGPRGRNLYRDVSYGVQAVPSGYGYSQQTLQPASVRSGVSARSEARLRFGDVTDGAYRSSAGTPVQRGSFPQTRQARGTPTRARSAPMPSQSAPTRSHRIESNRAPQRSAPARPPAASIRSSRGPDRSSEQPPK